MTSYGAGGNLACQRFGWQMGIALTVMPLHTTGTTVTLIDAHTITDACASVNASIDDACGLSVHVPQSTALPLLETTCGPYVCVDASYYSCCFVLHLLHVQQLMVASLWIPCSHRHLRRC